MLFRTIVNSTKILFSYLLIQPPSPKIKILQNSNLGGIRFGVDKDGNYGYIKAGADTVIPFKKMINFNAIKKFNYETSSQNIIADRDYNLVIFQLSLVTDQNTALLTKDACTCDQGTILFDDIQFFTAGYCGIRVYKDVSKGANIHIYRASVYGVYEDS